MRTLRVFTVIVVLTGTYAIAAGTLGGCGRDNDCDTDADCPAGQTCELCGNQQLVVNVCSGSIDENGKCDL